MPFLVLRQVWVGSETGQCWQCRYDMAGLPEGACCPECGSVPGEAPPRQRIVFDVDRFWRLVSVGVLVLLLVLSLETVGSLARYIIEWKVRGLGYSADVAQRYAAGPSANLDSRYPGSGVALFLLFAPMTVLLDRRSRPMVWLGVVAAIIIAWYLLLL